MWQGRAELLAGELAASREQVRALMAPREEPSAVGTADRIPADTPAPLRWWQRQLWGS
jgi:hypothetical protein